MHLRDSPYSLELLHFSVQRPKEHITQVIPRYILNQGNTHSGGTVSLEFWAEATSILFINTLYGLF